MMKMDSKLADDEMMDDPKTESEGKSGKSHKTMTMEDVADTLEEDFAEEIEDSKKYLRMSKVAEKAGDQHDSYYLLEMAKDEYTHASFIHEFMESHNLDIPEEQEKHFRELKEKMDEFFR